MVYLKILCSVSLWFGGCIGFLLTAPRLHNNSGGNHRLFDGVWILIFPFWVGTVLVAY